ncbi:MAG: tetratricopeptide repeat protein [Isosphaeraceae bacterium]
MRGLALAGLLALTVWRAQGFWAFHLPATLDPENDPVEALRLALDHLETWPGDLAANRLAARGLSQLIYPDEAEPYYDRLRRADRFNAQDAHARALGLTRANQRENAVAAYEAILAESPDDPLALRRLGAVQWSRGRREEALSAARRLAETPEGAVTGQILLAQVYHDGGRWEEAVRHARRVLELDPELDQLGYPREVFYLEFGDDLLRTGRTTEARQLMESALSRLDDVGLLEVLGQACLEEGDLDEADRHWRRAAERSPGRAKPWRVLGRIRLRSQRAEEAVTFLNRALEIDPEHYETLASLAAAYRVLGRLDQARELESRAATARRALPPSATGMGADLPQTSP